ncbi:MAG: hypothetical protein BWX64_01562 [Acidobacteria bacterium ADurb.Bin051]|nr:MAG: hypothetical protein BWX64_01562 [Acidobacteria bacterium ADurb.Bin051]
MGAAGVDRNRPGRLHQDGAGDRVVALQAGGRVPDQGDHAGGIGRRHRGAGHPSVGGVPARVGGIDVDAGSHDVRLQIGEAQRRRIGGQPRVRIVRRALVGVVRVGAVVPAGRADAEHLARAGRVADGVERRVARVVAVGVVPVREERRDAGGDPGVDDALVPVVVRLTAVAPRVVDDIGVEGGVRGARAAGRIGREHPLAALEQPGVGRAGTGLAEADAGHPLRLRRRADLVGAAVETDHGAHRVGAVIVRGARRGAVVVRVVPVVVVHERAAALPAAILVDQRVVGVAHAGVDVGDDEAAALVAERPDVGDAHLHQARLGGVGLPRRDLDPLRDRQRDLALQADRVDLRDAFEAGEQRRAEPRDGDRVVDPEHGVVVGLRTQAEPAPERLPRFRLRPGSEIAQGLVDPGGARVAIGDPEGAGEIRLPLEPDQDRGLLAPRERGVDGRLDPVSARAAGGGMARDLPAGQIGRRRVRREGHRDRQGEQGEQAEAHLLPHRDLSVESGLAVRTSEGEGTPPRQRHAAVDPFPRPRSSDAEPPGKTNGPGVAPRPAGETPAMQPSAAQARRLRSVPRPRPASSRPSSAPPAGPSVGISSTEGPGPDSGRKFATTSQSAVIAPVV